MMKKIMFILLAMMFSVTLFAQTEIPIPESIGDVLTNFTIWISSVSGVAGLTIILTATVLKLFSVTGSGLKQLISWAVGFILVAALNLLNLGFARDLLWYGVLAYGFAISITANLGYDIGILHAILKMFKLTKE